MTQHLSAEQIAETLPLAFTGGIREATRIVREHVLDAGEELLEQIVGALIKRSRHYLSKTSDQH